MNFEQYTKPSLIEPGVKYFLNQTLKQCHIIKNTYHNVIFNLGLFIAFLLVLMFILVYKYKGRLTPSEKFQKNKEKQQYILSKIKVLQDSKRKAHQELITGLPDWEAPYEPINKQTII
jgi:hypothetical protein